MFRLLVRWLGQGRLLLVEAVTGRRGGGQAPQSPGAVGTRRSHPVGTGSARVLSSGDAADPDGPAYRQASDRFPGVDRQLSGAAGDSGPVSLRGFDQPALQTVVLGRSDSRRGAGRAAVMQRCRVAARGAASVATTLPLRSRNLRWTAAKQSGRSPNSADRSAQPRLIPNSADCRNTAPHSPRACSRSGSRSPRDARSLRHPTGPTVPFGLVPGPAILCDSPD